MSILDHLDQLASFEPATLPVVSLYLNTQPDQHGRANFDSFVHKEFAALARTFPLCLPERLSFERYAERIRIYLRGELEVSTNGLAIFACAGEDDFFLALQLDAPVDHHHLHVGNQPHLFTLANIHDQYRCYAAVADTNSARILAFGLMKTVGPLPRRL